MLYYIIFFVREYKMQHYKLIKEGAFATANGVKDNIRLLKGKIKEWDKDKLSMYKLKGRRIGDHKFKVYYCYDSIYNKRKERYDFARQHKFAYINVTNKGIEFKFVDDSEYWRKILWAVIYPLIMLFTILLIFGFLDVNMFCKCLITACVAAISAAIIYIYYVPVYDREKATYWRDFEELLITELDGQRIEDNERAA